MAPKRKQQDQNHSVKKKKQKIREDIVLKPTISSEDIPKTQTKWTNKERVLVFSSRGISYRGRHLMNDMRTLMPHAKSESKMDKKRSTFCHQ